RLLRETGRAMDRNARTRWWFVQGLTVLGLAVVFGFFFLGWMPARRDYLTQRNFRQLADMSDQVQEALGNLHTSLTNAASGTIALVRWASQYVQNQSGIDPGDPDRNFIESLRGIEPKVELSSKAIDLRRESDAVWVGPQLSSSRGSGRYWLYLTYYLRGRTNTDPAFQVRTDLGALMQPVLARSEFDDVLIVNANGDVIFQSAEAGQRLTNFSGTAEVRL